MDEHLAAFGDRSTEELKLETESFRERPEELIELIRQHIPAGGPGEAAAEPAMAISRTWPWRFWNEGSNSPPPTEYLASWCRPSS